MRSYNVKGCLRALKRISYGRIRWQKFRTDSDGYRAECNTWETKKSTKWGTALYT